MPDPIATLILTRPREGSDRFLAEIGDRLMETVRVVTSPLTEIVATGASPDLTDVRGVIFTSANGVRFVGSARGRPAYCVGPATTRAATAAGWDARQCGETAEALVRALLEDRPPTPLLHIGGVHRRGDVATRLTCAGIETAEVDVYDQRLLTLSPDATAALTGRAPVLVPLFSPRAARHFADISDPQAPMHIVAISDAVMAETQDLPAASRTVAAMPDAQSMGNTVANLLRRVEAGHAPK